MDTKEKNKAPALHSKIKLVASRFFYYHRPFRRYA